MEWTLDRILGIIGVVLGIIALGATLAMDAKTKGELRFAHICFGLSALTLLSSVGAWDMTTNSGTLRRVLIIGILSALLGICVVEGCRWAYRRHLDATHKNAANNDHESHAATHMPPSILSPTGQHQIYGKPIIGEPVGHGHLVATASALDVGASPSGETIPDPPDWREPKTQLKLIFQDSPILSAVIRAQITRDIAAFHQYLGDLGLSITGDYPPIGVSNGPGASQEQTMGSSTPSYRSGVKITTGWVVDRRAVTGQYCSSVIADLLQRRIDQHPTVSTQQDMVIAVALSQYYNWSFWDYKPDAVGGYWSSPLWEIRRCIWKELHGQLGNFHS